MANVRRVLGLFWALVRQSISSQQHHMHFDNPIKNPPLQQPPSKHHGDSLGSLIAPTIYAALGGGITSFLKPSKQLSLMGGFPFATKSTFSFPNLMFGIGGATVGIGVGIVKGFHHCQEDLELATSYHKAQCDSKILQLNQSNNKEMMKLEVLLAGAGAQLNETQSSLQDMQQRLDSYFSLFLALLGGIVLMAMMMMYQNLQHKEERIKWTVTYNLQSERALQEKLQQQKKTLEDQKESLHAAMEEKKLQQHLLRAQHPAHHGQPLVLTLPPGFGQAAGERPGNRI